MGVTQTDRIQLMYNLAFTTPFHCGTGLRVGLTDRTIVRDHDGYLYVPGSTIKGVVREHCERLARLYEENDRAMRERIASPHEEEMVLRSLGHPPTMITRIFGSHYQPGHLFFDDARQTKQDKRQYDSPLQESKRRYRSLQTILSTQVQLDRPTGIAVSGSLYTSEFGIKHIAVQADITGWLRCTAIASLDNLPTYSLLLLLAGLQMVEHVGGNKSTGKGQCRCNITHLDINGQLIKQEQWQSWLSHLDVLSQYSAQVVAQEEEM